MRHQQALQRIIFWLISLLFLSSTISSADWEVLFTTKETVKEEKAVGYKGFRLFEGVEYGIVLRIVEGDFDLYLYNPGDRLVGKGKKKEKDYLILFTPPITEKGYKIVIKGKGEFRLILSQKK